MNLLKIWLDSTRSVKSNMAASKTKVPLSELVDKIETKVQRLYICIRGPATQWDYRKCCTTKPEVQYGGIQTGST